MCNNIEWNQNILDKGVFVNQQTLKLNNTLDITRYWNVSIESIVNYYIQPLGSYYEVKYKFTLCVACFCKQILYFIMLAIYNIITLN